MTETLHCGDNLEYMKSLQSESIDLIYGDILFGTGRDFGDYKDIKADRKTVENFYIPRITEMHRLLKPTGSIYLQMDYRINHYVRFILDDIFGYENIVNEIIWCYTMPNNFKKAFNRKHDNILFYKKTDDYIFNWKDVTINYSESSINRAKYASSETSIMGKNGKHLLDEGKIPESYWNIPVVIGNEKIDYQTQKPIELMARIIKASSNEGDVCADFFAGSGSFGVAAKKLNRNIILCDINPKAIELSKKRLQSETNLFNYI